MLFLLIAAVIGLLGLALLLLDVSRRRQAKADSVASVDQDLYEEAEEVDDVVETEPVEELEEVEPSTEEASEELSAEEPAPVLDEVEEEDYELEELPETDVADEVIETNLSTNAAPEEEEFLEGEEVELPKKDVAEAPVTPEAGVFEEFKGPGFKVIPGAGRRERKAWATHHGFEYSKVDNFLNDEWSRGAASAGAAAKDVVSGHAHNHEMYLVELAGIPVMAMRRAGSSDVVVDMRRAALEDELDSEDLIHVSQVGEFTILSNDQGAAERMIDVRVQSSLEQMPDEVTAVWMESDWVLAQTTKNSDHQTWDAMTKPLALMADAARVLPPRTGATQPIDVSELDPSRPLPNAPMIVEDDEEDAPPVIPVIEREEERTPLPSRAQSESHGVVEPRSVGGDEVEPIAEGLEEKPDNLQGTRILRDNTHKPTIFGD